MPRNPWLDDPIIEDDPRRVDVLPDGEMRHDAVVGLTQEDYNRLWNGWVCAWCYQLWPEQWPKHCTMPGCYSGTHGEDSNEMTPAFQRRYLEERFLGKRAYAGV